MRKGVLFGVVVLLGIISCALYSCSDNRNGKLKVGTTENKSVQTEKESYKGSGAPVVNEQEVSSEVSVYITPSAPFKGAVLTVRLAERNTKARFLWYVNGTPVEGFTGPVFSTEGLQKGDEVSVKVINDGQEIISDPVTIQNSPPRIRHLYLLPESPDATSMLTVDVDVYDADGDDVELSYKWLVNGEEIAENGAELKGYFKKGDEVTVVVTPSDGESDGVPVRRTVTIGNASPVVETSLKEMEIKDNVFQARISADDPDGDPLSFAVEEGPEGLSIDQSGLITWKIPANMTEDSVELVISVKDSEGGETLVNLPLLLKRNK